jgi:malate dehydrogenase (oxaloacetate-decarboxylating)
MCIAAAYELARCAEKKGISENYIVPKMDEWEVFVSVATAVGMKAIEQGVALKPMSRATIDMMMKTGLIPPVPKGV